MTIEKLENKIGFQMGFLLHSGKSVESTIENLKNIAIDFANSKQPIIALEAERLEWSLKNFSEATPISSLRKLEGEIKEVENDLIAGNTADAIEEYADCLMCLFDSAGRAGISPETIFEAFAFKLEKNKSRTWIKNPDNTYSHVPSKTVC